MLSQAKSRSFYSVKQSNTHHQDVGPCRPQSRTSAIPRSGPPPRREGYGTSGTEGARPTPFPPRDSRDLLGQPVNCGRGNRLESETIPNRHRLRCRYRRRFRPMRLKCTLFGHLLAGNARESPYSIKAVYSTRLCRERRGRLGFLSGRGFLRLLADVPHEERLSGATCFASDPFLTFERLKNYHHITVRNCRHCAGLTRVNRCGPGI